MSKKHHKKKLHDEAQSKSSSSSSSSSSIMTLDKALIKKFIKLPADIHATILQHTLSYGAIPKIYKDPRLADLNKTLLPDNCVWEILNEFLIRKEGDNPACAKAFELMYEFFGVRQIAPTGKGNTLTHIAAKYNNKMLVQCLKDKGLLQLDIRDDVGFIPIQYTSISDTPKKDLKYSLSSAGKMLLEAHGAVSRDMQFINYQTNLQNKEKADKQAGKDKPEPNFSLEIAKFFLTSVGFEETIGDYRPLIKAIKNIGNAADQQNALNAIASVFETFNHHEGYYRFLKSCVELGIPVVHNILDKLPSNMHAQNNWEYEKKYSELAIELNKKSGGDIDKLINHHTMHMLACEKLYDFEGMIADAIEVFRLGLTSTEHLGQSALDERKIKIQFVFSMMITLSEILGITSGLAKMQGMLPSEGYHDLAMMLADYQELIVGNKSIAECLPKSMKSGYIFSFSLLQVPENKLYKSLFYILQTKLVIQYMISNGSHDDIREAEKLCSALLSSYSGMCRIPNLIIKALHSVEEFEQYVRATEAAASSSTKCTIQWELGKLIASIYHGNAGAYTYDALEKVHTILQHIKNPSSFITAPFAKACYLISVELLNKEGFDPRQVEYYLSLAEKFGYKETTQERLQLAIKNEKIADVEEGLKKLKAEDIQEGGDGQLVQQIIDTFRKPTTEASASSLSSSPSAASSESTTKVTLAVLAQAPIFGNRAEKAADIKSEAKKLLAEVLVNKSVPARSVKEKVIEFTVGSKTYKTTDEGIYKISDYPETYATISPEILSGLSHVQQSKFLTALQNGEYRGKNKVIDTGQYIKIRVSGEDLRIYTDHVFIFKFVDQGNKCIKFVIFDKPGNHTTISDLPNKPIKIISLTSENVKITDPSNDSKEPKDTSSSSSSSSSAKNSKDGKEDDADVDYSLVGSGGLSSEVVDNGSELLGKVHGE